MTILLVLFFVSLVGSIVAFRKGGIYNPIEEPAEPTDEPLEPPTSPVQPVKPPEPTPVAPTPPKPVQATLENFLLAIRDFEGKPGDANYLNNNPGNCKYNEEGYLPMYGNVRKSPKGFAIFPTYELGWLYLKNMVTGQIHKRPRLTIYEFMLRYAPPDDNNPTAKYATFIGKRLGVDSFKYEVGWLLA